VVREPLPGLPGGDLSAVALVMLLMFLLDYIEITFVVVRIVGPVLLAREVDSV